MFALVGAWCTAHMSPSEKKFRGTWRRDDSKKYSPHVSLVGFKPDKTNPTQMTRPVCEIRQDESHLNRPDPTLSDIIMTRMVVYTQEFETSQTWPELIPEVRLPHFHPTWTQTTRLPGLVGFDLGWYRKTSQANSTRWRKASSGSGGFVRYCLPWWPAASSCPTRSHPCNMLIEPGLTKNEK